MNLHLDFETRCELPLKNVGTHKYTLHESFDVMCTAFALGDNEVKVNKGPYFRGGFGPFDLHLSDWAAKDSTIMLAHNATFEYLVWHNYLVPKWGFPEVPIERWRCTAAAASYRSLPRALDNLAKAISASEQKDLTGKLTMLKMCKPVKEEYHHLHGKWHETEEDFKILMEYCADDVATERACEKIVGLLPPAEQKIWELDHIINNRGISIDIPFAGAAVKMKEKIKLKLNGEMRVLAGCNASQVGVLTEKLNLPNMKAPTMKTLVAKTDTPKRTKDILSIRMDYATTSLSKFDAMMKYDIEGKVYGQFLYHGASTGRWSGKAIQFHNLPRGEFEENTAKCDMDLAISCVKEQDLDSMELMFDISEMKVMKSAIRGAVVPSKGRILRVMDFSQIEARVLPWLAGQEEVLDSFREGKDLYKNTASGIYGVPYEEVTKQQRFIGKTASLALGYQGGYKAFQKFAINFGVYVEEDRAEEVKRDWRAANQKIVRYWYTMEKAAIHAVKFGVGKGVKGKIGFRHEEDYLSMELPSGRKLWYYKPEIIDNKLTFMGHDHNYKWTRISTYGGCLTENATQATARDLLVCAMFNTEIRGHKIIGHVHDEIIAEDKLVDTHLTLSSMKEAMLDMPKWAEGLPVEADGFEGYRYRK